MATKRPLVLVGGRLREIDADDVLLINVNGIRFAAHTLGLSVPGMLVTRQWGLPDYSGHIPVIDNDGLMRWNNGTSGKALLDVPAFALRFGNDGFKATLEPGGSTDREYIFRDADGVLALLSDIPTFSGAMVTRGTNFSVGTGGAPSTDMDWTTESYDVGGYFASGSDNSAFTIPSGGTGRYVVMAQINWAAHATGMRVARMFVDRGSGYTNETGCPTMRTMAVTGAAQMTEMNMISAPLDLDVGDKVLVRVGQDSGGNLNVVAAPSSWFSIRRVY